MDWEAVQAQASSGRWEGEVVTAPTSSIILPVEEHLILKMEANTLRVMVFTLLGDLPIDRPITWARGVPEEGFILGTGVQRPPETIFILVKEASILSSILKDTKILCTTVEVH